MLHRLERSEGQAVIEFVLILPVIVTLVFVVIQMGFVFNNYIRVTDAARVAARAVSAYRFSGESACAVARNAVPDDLDVSCPANVPPGQPIQVTVSHPWQIDLPLLPLSRSGTLKSTVTEPVE